jgi:hypothetical protein
MPNKRKSRGQVLKVSCPCCEQRLWRLGSTKYHLFYTHRDEIKKELGITLKKASFLASQTSAFVDSDRWIEEFFCENHGTMWMQISKKPDGTTTAVPARASDWMRTTKTIDPNFPNPSVSEFTYSMARRRGKNLKTRD